MTDAVLAAFSAALRDDDAEELYERAPCGYLSTTPDGVIVKVNETFTLLTGYRSEDLVGRRTFAELLSAGGRIYHETHYAPLLRMQGAARAIALDVVRADGSRLPVLVNSILDFDDAGAPRVIRTAVFDATERRLYEQELLRAKQRAEASESRARELARTLQQSFIPPAPPLVPGLDVAAAYRPAGAGDEVGGDFYDIFEIAPDDWVVVVGDVCGKGVAAAVVTTLARYTLRGAAVRLTQPRQALQALNAELLADEGTRFCTVVLLRLRRSAGVWTATIGCGGHPLPLLIEPSGRVSEVGTPGTLVGVMDDAVFTDTEVRLGPGDTLLLFTDGIPEGRNGDEFYGENRLVAVSGSVPHSASDLVDTLLEDVLGFQNGNARDDIAVVALRVPTDG